MTDGRHTYGDFGDTDGKDEGDEEQEAKQIVDLVLPQRSEYVAHFNEHRPKRKEAG